MTGRVVLLLPKTAYRVDDFLAAARRAGVDVLVASDRCHVLDGVWRWPEDSVVVDFLHPDAAARQIVAAVRARPELPVVAIVPTEGETPALVAALAARELGLPHNDVEAARAARNKHLMRLRCAAAGVPVPRFLLAGLDDDPRALAARVAAELGWPCVVKPLFLSASRGVIRADDDTSLAAAHARVGALLRLPEVREQDPEAARHVLVEAFVPGGEVALEGMLAGGELVTLALFDKPDPLEGPFFEETLYVTPSRLPAETQDAVRRTVAAAARALGLGEGPVHAELRLAAHGPVLLEVAARSIGGLCARMLRFGTGMSLEDVILRHALGRGLAGVERERRAAGAMMLPIPSAGVLKQVEGIESARAVPGIDEVTITARLEQELVPLPEGSSYLGFLFAHGDDPAVVEDTLRRAHQSLRFTIAPTLPVARG